MSHTLFLFLTSWKPLIGIGTNIGFLIMFIELILFLRSIQAKELNESLWLSPCYPIDLPIHNYADNFVIWVLLLVSHFGRVNVRSIFADELELSISESEGVFLDELKADEFFYPYLAKDPPWTMWGSLAWLFSTDYWSATSGFSRNQIRCFFIALLRHA